MLRRAASLRLARTCTAADWPQLGEALGIPPGTAGGAIMQVHQRLEAAGRRADFEDAVSRLADMLDAASSRTDYGHRRAAMRDWVISPAEWDRLTAGLPSRSPYAEWGDRKRMVASAWVWTRVTGGERLFAPAVMTSLAAPAGQLHRRRDRVQFVALCWPHLETWTHGHYSELREYLNDYARQLTTDIDSKRPTW